MSQQFIYQLDGGRVWSKRGRAFEELEEILKEHKIEMEIDFYFNMIPRLIKINGIGNERTTTYYFPKGHKIVKRKLIKGEG